MTNDNIKIMVSQAIEKIKQGENMKELGQLELKYARSICQHSDKDRWTNDDGFGQFIVERCRICGLQQDGGIK